MARFEETARNLRRRLVDDPHRPMYHFLPPANWMNDPNGLIQWKGAYHLFYQYNPEAAAFGRMHWGHAKSDDLVHWQDLPLALAPSSDSPDADGCWSGYAVDNDGTPSIIYTGVRGDAQRPCVATGDDDLVNWTKYAGNPVIAEPPLPGMRDFRDHSVWREDGLWYQVIGSTIAGTGGVALLYRSRDLLQWEYVQPLFAGDSSASGEIWECPDFFPLDGRHLLIISPIPLRKALYYSGDYVDHTFQPRKEGVVDYGGHLYAPLSMLDAAGRRLMWGWLWEGRSAAAQVEAGWAGVMSLPRLLSLGQSGELLQAPPPELRSLRREHVHLRDLVLTPGSSRMLAGLTGDCLEIVADWEGGVATEFGLALRCSPDRAEQTLISYDRESERVRIDRRSSSLSADAQLDVHDGPLALEEGERLRFHLFMDRSVLELFANERTCLASRIYPSRADSVEIDLHARGGSVTLRSLDIWTMASIW